MESKPKQTISIPYNSLSDSLSYNYTYNVGNEICIGDIRLATSVEEMDALIEKLKKLLKDRDVQKYLGLLKKKNATTKYTG